MITRVYQHISGHCQPSTMSLEQMFAWNIRFEVITQTQEQHDFLYGLQMMYGRELEMSTWAEWKEDYDTKRQHHMRGNWKRPMPITFTTFPMDFSELH